MKPQSVNRRDFLKVSVLAGAGLVVGCYLPGHSKISETEAFTDEVFAPNAFVTIGTDGTVIISVSKSEMGQGVRTSLPMIVAEELDADWTKVQVEQAPGHSTKHGRQGTGGSSSVRTSWKPLRQAGATARAMLLTAAAQKWGVEPGTCRTEKGWVTHASSNRRLAYGELAEAAAKLPVPKEVTLKDSKDFHIVGTSIPRTDLSKIVDGSAVYGIDVKVPGMLIAVVARCPVFGGKVASFDATNAKAIPGVRHVVSIKSGVVVAADSFWQAMQGRRALEIKWDEGPNATLSTAGIRKLFEDLAQKPGATARNDGNTASALNSSAKKIEAVYEVPFLAHATMEPMNATADVRKESCEIWAPTQFPDFIIGAAAEITKLKREAIKMNITLLGGGFGRRIEPDYGIEAVQISQAIGAPVKVVWTREDDMHHDFYRPTSYHRLSAGFDEKGQVTSWKHHIVAPSIVGQRWPETIKNGLDEQTVEGIATMSYGIPNVSVEYSMANTAIPTGWWRSVYNTQNAFVQESFLDEVAAATGKDPYELRRNLLSKSPELLGVLELAATKAGWGKPLPEGHFRGIACHHSFNTFAAEVVEISVTKDGTLRVHRIVCALNCGIVVNPDMAQAQVESALLDGLSAALKGEITIENGQVQQSNFHDYELLRMEETPASIEIHFVSSLEAPTGLGEPPLPPVAPALANAIFAATGKRIRRLPIRTENLK